MSGSFNDRGELEISDGRLILCVGKKKSGKSILAKVTFDSYVGDRIVIDVAGDDGPSGGNIIDLVGDVATLPRKWPEHRRRYPGDVREPMTLRYVPDAGSPTFLEDIDHVVGMANAQGRREHAAGRIGCAVLIHEIGQVCPVGQTKAHMRRALMHNRHNHLTMIMCGPRPMTIDPLVLAQSDLVYTFELMNPADRKRLAQSMGWHPADFDAAVEELGRHEYLRFDGNEMKPEPGEEDLRVVHFDALPEDLVRSVK